MMAYSPKPKPVLENSPLHLEHAFLANMGGDRAQFLVDMSMNKIETRSKKKYNLHRSMQVSSVLFKAKMAVIMGKYHMRNDYDLNDVIQPNERNNMDDDAEFMYDDDDDDTEEPDTWGDSCDTDSNSTDSNADLSLEPECDTDSKQDTSDFENKENDPPQVSQEWHENNMLSEVKCNKCTKRRLTEVECAVESITNTKRQCTDNDNCCQSETEPMEGVQMSNLVDSFQIGFAGLLTENQTSNIYQDSGPVHVSCSFALKPPVLEVL